MSVSNILSLKLTYLDHVFELRWYGIISISYIPSMRDINNMCHSNTVWGHHHNNCMMSRALISHTKETTEI